MRRVGSVCDCNEKNDVTTETINSFKVNQSRTDEYVAGARGRGIFHCCGLIIIVTVQLFPVPVSGTETDCC